MDATAELSSLLEAESWDADMVVRIRQSAFTSSKSFQQFRTWVRQSADGGGNALKTGVGLCLLGDFAGAVGFLKKASDTADVKPLYLAIAHRECGEFDEALAQLEKAQARGTDALAVALHQVDTLRSAGRPDEAAKLLRKHARAGESAPEWHYQQGFLLELGQDAGPAADAYARALELDPNHPGALFRLAYLNDLHGNDDDAFALYRRCAENPPAPINALINLAVMCEDRGQYDQAIRCLQEVLDIDPNHARARLFLKDSLAGLTQYYDEIQERARDKRTAVLEIPITDFELSVRSRNCLKKMNINTLGDLLAVGEEELLSYKNFGETSLNEIKAVLGQKGLRLGQLMEEQDVLLGGPARLAEEASEEAAANDLLNTSVDELELSVRSRRCLERLGVRTLGDLAGRTESELMSAKNFGVTSLEEIKEQLTLRGLSLRTLE